MFGRLAQAALDLTPVGDLHRSAQAVHDWAAEKASPANPHMQGPLATYGEGVLRDTAGLISGATSPEGVATAGAAVAAPEIVGPAMVVHGVHNMIQSWGSLKNPDVLQNELNSAAEVAGGVGATGEALRAGGGPGTQLVKQASAERAQAAAPDVKLDAFKKAVPPSKTTPYSDTDVMKSLPYLEKEHLAESIDSPLALRGAADKAIDSIETRVADAIASDPSRLIKTSPIEFARNALKGSVRRDFLAAGLKELENYDLGWEREGGKVDEPLTLQKADDIRAQLNQENKAVLLKNNYDIHTARTTDPAFAAREAAAEALRNGVYDELQEMGFKDMRNLRLDEGSLLKIRNATLKQEFNGEKPVAGTEKGGALRKKVAGAVRGGSRALGAAAGAHVAGTPGALAGEAIGDVAGGVAGKAVEGGKMTRGDLIKQAFSPVPVPQPVQGVAGTAAAGAAGAAAGNANQEIHFRASDGSMHAIPANENALAHAKQIDPGLQVVTE